jgi:hypothetical protein
MVPSPHVPDEDPIGDTIAEVFQRATLPVGEPRRGSTGTAFVYNHLLESRGTTFDLVRQAIAAAVQRRST